MKKSLAIIPARGGSQRIPNKNIKIFNGKPLIYYPIIQAIQSGIFDKIIVDTDSLEIAKVAIRYGAEVPFLRPEHLATSQAKIGDVIEFLLRKLKEEHKYQPHIITLLQTTSPLRELEDINACYELISKPKIKSVCTITETHPRFYQLNKNSQLILVNKETDKTTNTTEMQKGYILNGCMVYMIKTNVFLQTKKFVDEHTVGVITPKWRSVDLDHPEDWVLAEFLHKHKDKIDERLKRF
ncbi:MAG: hypothetical protein A2431_02290 [Candidatus Zambryskibacteria bacterium RIFOXYC1_FULL_39_10]|uniref:Acylneuraminate cytidylyltransferase n=1 Tax=Candidatus Zambryskibacteria bacterium RIFOXYC1_FULL_39_10 TaxID=1802779 RepID=A0A1G2V3J9_9BACT|nr:MAG: hypothetical protein A2431_02290 [Candidatus Zambryskibacteria bacterium RIFOXYC1_FULL_39_10]OHB16746.1 MAG: hypothetical protein A2605_01140 [Candidatus Zambryskibacteria bacterium RIFOXYD1_FULL_39_35]